MLRRSPRTIILTFFFFCFFSPLILPAVIQTEVYHTFSLEGDDSHDIVITIPENWMILKEGNNDAFYDLQLIDKSGDRNCKVFLGIYNPSSTAVQDFLANALFELRDSLYSKMEVSHSQMSSSSELIWHSFQVHPQNCDPFQVCLVVYLLKHYLIGFVVENHNHKERLSDDCSLMLRHISLRTHQK